MNFDDVFDLSDSEFEDETHLKAAGLRQFYPFELTRSQEEAVAALDNFLNNPHYRVFILKGYAGTGKSFLTKGILEYVHHFNRQAIAMAPTGRAARILTKRSGFDASTIHSTIYKHETIEISEEKIVQRFTINNITVEDHALLIVDEASMVGNNHLNDVKLKFGSGKLIDDLLIAFNLDIRSDVKLLIIGDGAQLPPVGSENSPALDPKFWRDKGFSVAEYELTDVVRIKDRESPVITIADRLRKKLFNLPHQTHPIPNTDDYRLAPYYKLLDNYYRDLPDKEPQTDRIIISYTNKRVKDFNDSVRRFLWEGKYPLYENQPVKGDIVICTRNQQQNSLLNGDILKVIEVDPQCEVHLVKTNSKKIITKYKNFNKVIVFNSDTIGYKLKFRKITAQLIDEPFTIYELIMLENFLWSGEADVDELISHMLIKDVLMRFKETYGEPDLLNPDVEVKDKNGSKVSLRLFIEQDRYFNAVPLKFAFAITCHKAQGGEWPMVYVDGVLVHKISTQNKTRWYYTAVTRTSKFLFFGKDTRT